MPTSSCILEIDLEKITSNYQLLAGLCKNSELAVALKADAYGIGADKVASALSAVNCQNFFVARLIEGIELRKTTDANIYVLDGVIDEEAEYFRQHNLIPILNHLGQVETWETFNINHGLHLPYGLHIDTGMNRLGMPQQEFGYLKNNDYVMKQFPPSLIMSHLCAGATIDCMQSQNQLAMFNNVKAFFPESKLSLANSAGLFLGIDYHFDMVRIGAALYGITDHENIVNLQNPIALHAPILQLKNLKSGSTIGYNMTFVAERDIVVATLPIGYADGYSLKFSNEGSVYINGQCAKVIGRVSMDLITVDVTHIPVEHLYIGSLVEIIGPHCSLNAIARQIDTIGYEILTNLGKRYKRVYKYSSDNYI